MITPRSGGLSQQWTGSFDQTVKGMQKDGTIERLINEYPLPDK